MYVTPEGAAEGMPELLPEGVWAAEPLGETASLAGYSTRIEVGSPEAVGGIVNVIGPVSELVPV